MKLTKTFIMGAVAATLVAGPVAAQETPAAGMGGRMAAFGAMAEGSYVMIGGMLFVVIGGALVLADDDNKKKLPGDTTPPPPPPPPPATTTTSTTTTTS